MNEIKFGIGKTLLTSYVDKTNISGILFIQEGLGTGNVGELSSTKNFKPREEDTLLHFSNTDSIDSLVDELNHLKKMMQGEYYNCRDYTLVLKEQESKE